MSDDKSIATLKELIDLHGYLSESARQLMERKSADYGNGTDPMANLRAHGRLGVVIRMHDKLARLEAAAKRPLAVADESVWDTCIDIMNYAVLYLALAEEEEAK